MTKRILLSYPHMGQNEIKYIEKAFEDNWIAPLGQNVDEFERDIENFTGAKGGASAVSSGTGAIHLALDILGVGKEDIVFVPSFTFVATVNPVLYQGAIPIFIDSEPDTWNMSPEALEQAFIDAASINKLPKAVIVVNLYGQVANYDEIRRVTDKYEVPIIEDAAESLGSSYKEKKSGLLGDIGIFSFNGNKIITTSGGGALVSNNRDYIERSRFLATQARDIAPYYQHSHVGYNYRLSNISAGIGRGQMEVLPNRIEKRRKIFDLYTELFRENDAIKMMPELEQYFSNRWLSTLTINTCCDIEDVVKIINEMSEKNIEVRALWKPLHLQPLFRGYKFYKNPNFDKSVSEDLFSKGLCLPSSSQMSLDEQTYVADSLLDIINNQ